MSNLKFSGKDAPADNGRKQAGRVLLNLGTYADGDTGFLDFVRIDGVTILAPCATIKYPMGRVETVVIAGENGLLYSVEVARGTIHSAIQQEDDVMYPRDFTLPSPQAKEPNESTQPEESQPPTESPEPTESQQPTESPKPTESQQPTESPRPSESPSPSPSPKPTPTPKPSPAPKPSGTPAPAPSQSAEPSVSPTAPAEVTPPVVDNTPQPSDSGDPNHVAYVPGSTVDIGGGKGPSSSESPEPSETEPSTAPVEPGQEQEPAQNSLLRTLLRVAIIIMLGIVVLIIVIWTKRVKEEMPQDK